MNIEFFAGLAAGWIAGGSLGNAIDAYRDERPVTMVVEILIAVAFLGGYFVITSG